MHTPKALSLNVSRLRRFRECYSCRKASFSYHPRRSYSVQGMVTVHKEVGFFNALQDNLMKIFDWLGSKDYIKKV